MRAYLHFFYTIAFSVCSIISIAQTDSVFFNFTSFDLKNIHSGSDKLTSEITEGELTIKSAGKQTWEDTKILIGNVDLTSYPRMCFRVKSTENVTVRIDLVEQIGSSIIVSNALPSSKSIKGDNQWNYIYFDLTGHFDQAWPGPAKLNPKNITGIDIILNPGGQFTGSVVFDDIALGRAANIPTKRKDKYVYTNQIGFYPVSEKTAVICGSKSSKFSIVSVDKKKTFLTGNLSDIQYWNYADDSVQIADFSNFKDTGTYLVHVEDIGYSAPFKIKGKIYSDLAKASIKAYFFQRSGCEIQEKWGGIWHHPLGTPDTAVLVHGSAASDKRPEGFKIKSPRGWYDAGDYNKYIVNSGITMYTLLAIMEQYPDYVKGINLNIPESGNNIPDILDEILWNLRWMQTMQDPNDGGVYHKLTHANFESMVLPNLVNETRYVVQKSTSATLDFCAVMAQASRILKNYNKELPGLADSCMSAAVKAWAWAKNNPRVYYDQNSNNNKFKPPVYTGAYGDGYLIDEFDWAASEMLISTGNELMLEDTKFDKPLFMIPDWANVQALGLMSLAYYRDYIYKQMDTTSIKEKFITLADSLVDYSMKNPFLTSMGQAKWQFCWGSNAVACNSSIFLLQAYLLTGNEKYYKTALNNFNYLLGCNPTGYCFVTGQGTKSPMFIHHRLSIGDNAALPVPGLLSGGPQPGREDGCSYEWEAPAKNFSDDVCSFSTNEIAINWNAPLAYLACAFEAIESHSLPKSKTNPRTKLVFPELASLPKLDSAKKNEYMPIIVYPNMRTGSLRMLLALLEPAVLEIKDADGRIIVHDFIEKTGTIPKNYPVNLRTGTYIITLNSKNLQKIHTIMINP